MTSSYHGADLPDRERERRGYGVWDARDDADLLALLATESQLPMRAPALLGDLESIDDPAEGPPSMTEWQRRLDAEAWLL